ncbi:MAG: DinB family protein [Candidatus Hodarchaeales archaeon]
MTESLNDLVSEVKNFPSKLQLLIETIPEDQLNQTIENWSIKDIIHHLADTHIVIYIRIKEILVNQPISVKPVNNQTWSALVDYKSAISSSLNIISGIHERLSVVLDDLTPEEFSKTFNHPERGEISLNDYIRTLVTHGNGHIEKIQNFSSFSKSSN